MLPLFLIYLVFVIVRPHEYVASLAGVAFPGYVLGLAFVFLLFRSGKWFATPQHLLLPAFIVCAAVSRIAMGWMGGAVYALEELIPLLMFFLIVARVAEEPTQLMLTLKLICGCTFVLAAHGLDQLYNGGVGWTGQTWNTNSGGNRIQYIGVFADPNDLAMLFVACFPLCVFFARAGPKLMRLAWLLGAVLLVVGIYLTNSRGGLLVLLLEIAIWSAIRLGSVATGALAVALIPAVFAATRLSTLNPEEESAAGRVDAWYVALQLFREHPLFGVGYGLFADHNEITAHNSWMLVLAELGLPGYLLWFTLVGISLQMMWTISRFPVTVTAAGSPDPAAIDRSLAVALLWSACGMMATAFFLSRSYSILIFLFWGCAAGHYLGARQRAPALPSLGLESVRRWAGLSVASIVGFFVLVRALLLVQ